MTNSVTNEINKIKGIGDIVISPIGMTSLLFNNGIIQSKTRYSITDGYINVLDTVEGTLCLYQHTDTCQYYEYNISLKKPGTKVEGFDKFNNKLKDLDSKTLIVFVNGYKLLPNEFTINSDYSSITIHSMYPSEQTSTVIIYVSEAILYKDQVVKDSTWNQATHSFDLNDYTHLRYMFFINGQLITHDKIIKTGDIVTLNVTIREGIDIVDYYRLSDDTKNLLFAEQPGYFSYGPYDDYDLPVPDAYDTIVTFTKIARLAVDDLRPGFFIKEENGDGCLMITDNNYETTSVKAISIYPFKKQMYAKEEYFLQVPNARSILHYISEFDLQGTLFPELLGIFQKLLLNETYDSLQRLKNIRSINKVDSSNINALINFLGLNIKITNLTLEKKHALLEELTNFYKVVGTRESYNFYNFSNDNSHIIKMEQLFTPIEDLNADKDPIRRYVTFRTAEELGAVYHREYVYPVTDYGYVGVIANPIDSLSNTPNNPGVLEDPNRPIILHPTRHVYITNEQGESVLVEKPVEMNQYVVEPTPGPNKPTIDYGLVTTEKVENTYDYGLVTDEIKGKWIEWYEWNRPTNWYPTNHVNVAVQVPAEVDYDTFMKEFKNAFYDIASTVVYIHSIIEVYTFGNENPGTGGGGAGGTYGSNGTVEYSILSTPLYHDITYSFTNDPHRQADIPVLA